MRGTGCCAAVGSGGGSISVMQPAQHGRGMESGGQLLAQGRVLEDEAVSVQGGGLLSPSAPRSRGGCRVVTSRQ